MRPIRERVWFYRPSWYFGTWKPFWFGNDEYHYKTIVFGWNITGQIVVALWEFRNTQNCEECPINPWRKQ